MKFTENLKMDKVNEGGGAAGGMPTPDSVKPAAEQPPTATPPPAEAPGNEPDHNFGYEKTPAAAEPPKEEGAPSKTGDTPPETPVTKISEIKEPGTGYGEEPPKVEEVPPAAPKPGEAPPAPDEYDKVLGHIPKENAAEIKAFAIENKVSPEIAKKWADKAAEAIKAQELHAANMERQAEQQKNAQRKAWHDELKADPTFGGASFQSNVVRAEKVLAEFMPETKKFLTERKSMLPPYVMRDLAKMSAHLYATDRLNPGEPIVKAETEKDIDRVKDFYS